MQREFIREKGPSVLRKSGMPLSVETPAPPKNTIRLLSSTYSFKRLQEVRRYMSFTVPYIEITVRNAENFMMPHPPYCLQKSCGLRWFPADNSIPDDISRPCCENPGCNASYLVEHPMVYIDLEDGTHAYEIFSCYETSESLSSR